MLASPEVPAAAAVKPSLAQQVVAFGQGAWNHLLQLDAREAGINILISAAIVAIALGMAWLLRRLLNRVFARLPDPASGEGPKNAVGVTWMLLRLTLLGAALVLVLNVWGIDLLAWMSGAAGARLLRLVLILVLVSALVEVAGFTIRRMVEGFARRSGEHRRAAQLRSLGPLLTGTVQGVLVVVGLLTFLSEMGVKVGPLLASAGVVGIAVGFGAQTLVKDLLTGLFLIAEDVVSVDDNVRVGDVSGVVEAMTLRTIRLRATNGTLHIFPYSEAQVIHNRTKVFSTYLFAVPLNRDADVDRALAVMARLGAELQSDPTFGPMITRPFEVLGVDSLGASAITVKARVTTHPKSQWKVGREYNLRLKRAFDAEHIASPFTAPQGVVAPS